MTQTTSILKTIDKYANNTWKDIVKCEEAVMVAERTLIAQKSLCDELKHRLATAPEEKRNILTFFINMFTADIDNLEIFIKKTRGSIAQAEKDIANLTQAAQIIKAQQKSKNLGR